MANELPGLSGAIRRVTAAAAIAVSAAVLVAGCAAGQSVQTANQRPPVDGASTDAGAISIRAASIAPLDDGSAESQGSDAQLHMVIINNGTQQIQLQSVSSPAAQSARLSTTGASQPPSASPSSTSESASPSGSASASGSTSASGSASASGSTSASGSASPGTSGSATASPLTPSSPASSAPASTPISIPPGGAIQVGFGSNGPSIVLSGLTTELFPAQTVPVTLTFSDGSTVNLDVPVALSSNAPSAPVVSDATEATD